MIVVSKLHQMTQKFSKKNNQGQPYTDTTLPFHSHQSKQTHSINHQQTHPSTNIRIDGITVLLLTNTMKFTSTHTEHVSILPFVLLLSTTIRTSHVDAHAGPLRRTTETCGFYDNERSSCKNDPDCVWMSDKDDTRPKTKGGCYDTTVIAANGSCAAEDFVIESDSECEKVDECFWDGDECAPTSEWEPVEWPQVEESCEYFGDQKDPCDANSDCVWMSDPRDVFFGECYSKADIADTGDCAVPIDDLIVQSKSDCNSIKGCSFKGGDANECAVALDQLACDSGFSDDKTTCQDAGCISKKKKKKRKKKKKKNDITCNGRWETEFLSTLKNEDGGHAKKAIEDEYGESTYKVVIVKSIKKQRNPGRIQLNVDDNNVVIEKPEFG